MEARSALFAGLIAGFALLGGPSLAREVGDCEGRPSATRLIVQVGHLKSNEGEVAFTLYPSDPRRFLAPRGKLSRARVRAVAPMTQACFYLPSPGAYALALYHDANANRDFDRNSLGMPSEGYAFSNDAPTKFGVPSFDAVRFVVGPGDTTLRLKMRYGR